MEREVISVLYFSSFGRGVELIVVNTWFLNTLESHRHKFSVGTQCDSRDGLTVISSSVVRLGFLFLFGIINDTIVASDVEKPI